MDADRRALSLDGDAMLSRTQKSSRLEVPQEGKPDSVISQPTANINRSLGLRARVEPSGWVSADFGVTGSFSDDESFSAVMAPGQPADEPETRTGIRRAFTARLEMLKQLPDTRLTFDLGANEQELTYRWRTNFSYTGNSFNWKGNFKTKVVGTDVDMTLSSNQDELKRVSDESTDTHNNVFEGKLAKRLSRKFQARFNWLVRVSCDQISTAALCYFFYFSTNLAVSSIEFCQCKYCEGDIRKCLGGCSGHKAMIPLLLQSSPSITIISLSYMVASLYQFFSLWFC